VVSESTLRDWSEVSRRNARSVQTTIGWVFWDPGAVARYELLGLPGGLGYIASRSAPFADAGPDAIIAAFGSISELGIRVVCEKLGSREGFMAFWRARNDAVLEGLQRYAPEIIGPLRDFSPRLWGVARSLPTVARPFCASHRSLEVPDDPVLSGWHAVNFLREWRGDTHWALVAANGLSGGEASILHNAWLGYEGDWLSLSRRNTPGEIDAAWELLESKGLASERTVNQHGLDLRQALEDRTDELAILPWQLLGFKASMSFAERFEPPCEKLLARVDETAGPNFQPASRSRRTVPRPAL
jgi:hypothetical protein